MSKDNKTMQECFKDVNKAWNNLKQDIIKAYHIDKLTDWFSEHYTFYLLLRFIAIIYIMTIMFMGLWKKLGI
jgi:hypothetical protein